MPEIGTTRELSVGEVNSIQHKKNVSIISILAFVFLGAFFFSLRDLSPSFAIGIVFLLGFFLISFINIRFGFLLVILAFLLSPEISLPMSKFRDFTLRIEDMLLIVLTLAWLGRLAMGLQKHFILSSPLNLPIAMIVLWNIICSWKAIMAGTVDTQFSVLTNLKIIEFFLVYAIVASNLNDLREAKFLFCILLLTAFVVGVYACLQIPHTQIFTENRLTAPFEGTPEPNTLGAYLAIMFGMALSILLYAKKSFLRNLSFILVVLLPFPIMFSFSRSAYFATIAIVIMLALVSRRRWLIITGIIVLLLSPFILPKPVIDRLFYNFVDARYYGVLDQSFGERLFAFRKAWYYIVNYPIFGGGITAAGGILDNHYARIIIETGLIGLALFFWLIFRLIKMGFRLYRIAELGWIRAVGLSFVAIVIGLLMHCWGNITFYIIRIAEPFWAIAGITSYMYFSTVMGKPPSQEIPK
jgi:hypothetical protein